MSFSAYVICTTPRSGSTLLCDLLMASGVAGQPHSYLRSEDIGYWANLWGIDEPAEPTDSIANWAYLSAMIRAGTGSTGIFGLRLMWESVSEATKRLQTGLGSRAEFPELLSQELGSTLLIYLSRHDKVAQAVSLVRAKQTGLWHVAADGSERERTAAGQSPVFDTGQLTQACAALEVDDAQWSSFFEQCGIQPMRLFYEDLAAHPQEALADTLATLGQDQTIAATITVQTAKMADAMSADWATQLQIGVTAR